MTETEKLMKELRYKLNKLVEDMDSCDKDYLLQISRQMDEVINEYIKEKDNLDKINRKE